MRIILQCFLAVLGSISTFGVGLMAAPPAAAPTPSAAQRVDLELTELALGDGTLELSGIGRWRGKLVGVSDGGKDHFLYELSVTDKQRLKLKPLLDLAKLDGYADYQAHLAALTQLEEGSRRIDLEGVAVCGDDVYLINERVRELLRITAGKKIEQVKVDFSGVKIGDADLFAGGANAGFEGIAADCAAGVMYVAKERDPRLVLVIDMKSWKVTDQFDFPTSDRAGQQVINIWNGQGLMQLGPDIAALDFDGGYLYALERNTYEIAKLDVKTKTVVARTSYFAHERGLYETGEPFGIAEALLVEKDTILIGLDNNQSPFTNKTQKERGVSGVGESLMRLTRPKGF